MNCALCHAPIPEGVSECLNCGTPTSYSVSEKGEARPDEEKISPPPSTQATPQPYPAWGPSQAPFPYYNPFPAPRPSKPSFLMGNGFIVLSISMIALILIGSSLFIYLGRPPSASSSTVPNPYSPSSGSLLINDALQNNNAGWDWMDYTASPSIENQGCLFTAGAYHVVNDRSSQPYMSYCLALNTNFNNFTYQIQATLLKGTRVGIVFRQMVHFRYYYFEIGIDGSYDLSWNNGDTTKLITSGVNSAIRTGLNQPNLLAVVANGSTLDLYANKLLLARVTDKAYAGGRIGAALESDDGRASDAAFSHLMLWT